jgi:hypothetical protein
MATGICSCELPTFPSMGRPNCVIEMRTMAFPIIVPRFKADGVTRNELDPTSATIGQNIKDLLLASVDAEARIYPFPRVEEPTFERSDSVMEEAPSGRKFRIFGQGGIYTLNFKTYAKDAVAPLLAQAERLGCSDFDFFYVSVDGNLWGQLVNGKLRGYEADSSSYDAFKEFATDATVEKLNVMWDLDQDLALGSSYAITEEELGYKATTLSANIHASQTLTASNVTTLVCKVNDGFGAAGVTSNVTGLVTGDFTCTNAGVTVAVTVAETPASSGSYVLTIAAQTAGDTLKVSILKAGYEIDDATVTAL